MISILDAQIDFFLYMLNPLLKYRSMFWLRLWGMQSTAVLFKKRTMHFWPRLHQTRGSRDDFFRLECNITTYIVASAPHWYMAVFSVLLAFEGLVFAIIQVFNSVTCSVCSRLTTWKKEEKIRCLLLTKGHNIIDCCCVWQIIKYTHVSHI